MKRFLLLLFFYFLAGGGVNISLVDQASPGYADYIICAEAYINGLPESRKYLTPKIRKRYIYIIGRASYYYNVNPLYLARQIEAESRFKWWASNSLPALGPMGVRPKFWNHVLFRIPNPPSKCDPKYFNQIGYGVYSGAYILRHYLNRFDDDYKLALLAYWAGPNSEEFKKREYKKYVNGIIYGK